MNHSLKIIAAAATLAAMSWAPAQAQSDVGVTDKEITIGAVYPYTGPAGQLGYTITMGLRLGAEEINAAGGINGRKIKLVVEDDQYVPANSVLALQKLVDMHKVFALVGISGGSHGMAMMPTIEKNKFPTINPAVTTPAHYANNRPVFGVGLDYEAGALEMLRAVNKLHPGEKWVSLVQDDESGAPREAGYDHAVKELGLNSLLKLRFKPRQMDFSAEILRIKAAGATAVHLGGLPAINASIIKEAKKQGLNLKFAGLWTDHTPPMLELAGAEGDGMYIYDFVPAITDREASGPFLKLVERYVPKDDQPKANRYTMLGFISMKVMADAIAKCGKDVTRDCVSSNLEKTRNFAAGVGAPVSYGPNIRMSAPAGNLLKIDAAGKRFVPAKS
ncbi:MAG TPA: ABC transporter substrate-binding protein [Ramlibacter sp.]|nr:ABC transporter substrate-binding protein [Ramlibacter sp.]